MKWIVSILTMLVLSTFILSSCGHSKEKPTQEEAEQIKQNMQEEAEVRAQAQQYVEAFNQRDLDKIISFWSPEAVYKNPITGNLVQGRVGIKEELKEVFERLQGGIIEFRVETVDFPAEGKASETGIAKLMMQGKEPIHSDYKMIHVKEDGKWLIFHVSQLDFGVLQSDE